MTCGANSTRAHSAYLESAAKRALDLAVSIALLPLAATLMLAVGSAVLIFDGRPVLLMQSRAGRGGRIFRMPKFRTLRKNGPGSDPEPTRLGRFLRRHRLDELPQIFSVLSGAMSLVGPRPELPEVVAAHPEKHSARLSVKPGATGLWQIRGDRRKMIHQEVGYDLLYLKNACLSLDLRLLFLTGLFMARPGAFRR